MALTAGILQFLSQLISFYLVLIFIYVLLSWFPGSWSRSAPVYWLSQIVRPYLNLFRRLRFLQIGMLDLSPMLAISLLYFVQSILRRAFSGGSLSLQNLLITLFVLVFQLLGSILMVFIILLGIRLVVHFVNPNSNNPFFYMVDRLAASVVSKFLPSPHKEPSLRTMLIFSFALFLGAWLLLNFLVRFIA